MPQTIELIRSTKDEKRSQLTRLGEFHARHNDAAPAMLKKLQQAAIANANAFEVLMDAARVCSLGQITNALFEVGGQYRRSMQVDLETSCCQSGLGRQRGPSFLHCVQRLACRRSFSSSERSIKPRAGAILLTLPSLRQRPASASLVDPSSGRGLSCLRYSTDHAASGRMRL